MALLWVQKKLKRPAAALGWPHAPFEIPDEILAAWRAAGQRNKPLVEAWENLAAASSTGKDLLKRLQGLDQDTLDATISTFKADLSKEPVDVASRVASQKTLERLNPALPSLIGGSADLTGSNNTRTPDLETYNAENYSGRYIHYGVREHGMAAAMNGLCLHGGVTAYGGAFMVFSDYCRASIRLAALSNIPSVFVMTHDSIGLGEDGPTHQPVEHLAALRAIPNLNTF